jgi:hypothetical protein
LQRLPMSRRANAFSGDIFVIRVTQCPSQVQIGHFAQVILQISQDFDDAFMKCRRPDFRKEFGQIEQFFQILSQLMLRTLTHRSQVGAIGTGG